MIEVKPSEKSIWIEKIKGNSRTKTIAQNRNSHYVLEAKKSILPHLINYIKNSIEKKPL